jgi:hypothetical protein
VLGEQRLPFRVGGRQRVGGERLDHHQLGAITPPIAALDHLGLGALHVDLEEVERSGRLRGANLGQRGERHRDRIRTLAELR